MARKSLPVTLVAVLLIGAIAAAQAHAPVVTMSVTLPDGRTQELTATESGLATLTLKDGTEYGFRPTIQDSSPWNRIVVTVFKSATTSSPTTVLGEIELRRGGPAMESKTNPPFKVSVPTVSAPTSQTESSSNAIGRPTGDPRRARLQRARRVVEWQDAALGAQGKELGNSVLVRGVAGTVCAPCGRGPLRFGRGSCADISTSWPN